MSTTGTSITPASARRSAALRGGGYTPGRASSRAPGQWTGGLNGLLDKHLLEIEGWSRKMSATLAYLKQAQSLLTQAERKISEQQSRINLLEDLATTDELTGLKNRRGFRESFVAELERSERGSSKGGLLVMIDLDNFKTVNDSYGHPAGDAALKLVAHTLLNQIRKTDIAARLGGDEFVLLLTNTNKADAAARAQSIAWQINNLSLAWYGDIIPLHASVGLKSFGKGDKEDAIMHAADTSLYTSKFDRRFNRGLDKKQNSIGGAIG